MECICGGVLVLKNGHHVCHDTFDLTHGQFWLGAPLMAKSVLTLPCESCADSCSVVPITTPFSAIVPQPRILQTAPLQLPFLELSELDSCSIYCTFAYILIFCFRCESPPSHIGLYLFHTHSTGCDGSGFIQTEVSTRQSLNTIQFLPRAFLRVNVSAPSRQRHAGKGAPVPPGSFRGQLLPY